MRFVAVAEEDVAAAVRAVRGESEAHALVIDIAARAAVQHLLRWARERDESALLAWIAETSRRYSNVALLERLLTEAAARTFGVAHLRNAFGLAESDVAVLSRRVAATVEKTWRPLLRTGEDNEIDALIDDFIVALEGTDVLTAEHSRAVGSWSARIARRMGLGTAETTFARRAGLLHDIGKIRVPVHILAAPRRLTTDEWTLMRAHTVDGEELLAGSPMLQAFVGTVRSHHERMDGRGYPDAIPALELPVVTRIVTVADGFNAMIALRPYRRPLHPSEALDELERHRRSQFDPDIVDALADVVGGREEVSALLADPNKQQIADAAP